MFVVVVDSELARREDDYIECISSFHSLHEAQRFCIEWDEFFLNYPCNGSCTLYDLSSGDFSSLVKFLKSLRKD